MPPENESNRRLGEAQLRTYLSRRADAFETERRRRLEQDIRARAEIERVSDQTAAHGRVKTPRPPPI
jgi:hypothetical protein